MPAMTSFSRYDSWQLPAQVLLLCAGSPALKNTVCPEAIWAPLVSQTVAVIVPEEAEIFPMAMPVENVPFAPVVLSNGRSRVAGDWLWSGAVPSPMATFRKIADRKSVV